MGLGGEMGPVLPAHGELAKVLGPAADIALPAALGIAALDPFARRSVRARVVALGEDVARRHGGDILWRTAKDLAGEAIHEGHALGRDVAFEKGIRKLEAEILQILPQGGKFGFQGVDIVCHRLGHRIPKLWAAP